MNFQDTNNERVYSRLPAPEDVYHLETAGPHFQSTGGPFLWMAFKSPREGQAFNSQTDTVHLAQLKPDMLKELLARGVRLRKPGHYSSLTAADAGLAYARCYQLRDQPSPSRHPQPILPKVVMEILDF
jgi:hypothetical protein